MTLRKQALTLYTPPFRCSALGFIVDSNSRIVASINDDTTGNYTTEKEVGAIIAAALNAFWEKQE